MKSFWALRVHEGYVAKLQQMEVSELTHGNVTVEVHFSGVNYKDALAGTGKGKILKRFPLNAGIDASGIVIESHDSRFQAGDQVFVHGCNVGENFDGGFSEVIKVDADSLMHVPSGLTLKETMILGTAGFTAALALQRMEQMGQKPSMGPILITGASGGVGSFATQLFAQNGYDVIASSGKHEAIKYLKSLGAKEVIPPQELTLGNRPLESVRFGGAVDNVGGEMLSHILAHVQLWGSVASIGMAQSADMHATVMPFILRGVNLIGVSSNNCPQELRKEIWQKLATTWKPKQIESLVSRTIGLKDLMQAFDDLLHRKIHGRILVEIRK